MSTAYFSQASSSVMSIDAITSPCYASENISGSSVKSRQSSISSTSSSKIDFGQLNLVDNDFRQTTESTLVHSLTSVTKSPSFSSFSSSDHESDFNVSHSSFRQHSAGSWFQPLFVNRYRHSRVQTNNSIFTDPSEEQFSTFNFFDENKTQKTDRLLNYDSTKSKSPSRKGDALAVRRARNKLASAKYRAKKQALTHAMQERIMQLATQVMALRDELSQTKKNEMESKIKYERLLKYHQHNSIILSDNVTIKPLL